MNNAAVKMNRLVPLLAIVLLSLAIGCSGETKTEETDAQVVSVVEEEEADEVELSRASLELPAGQVGVLGHISGARIEIPSGATDETVTVSISEVAPPDIQLPASAKLGKVFDVSIGQAELAYPALIHIPYEHTPGMTAEDIRALHYDEDAEKWEVLNGEVDDANQVIIVEVSDLSWFSTIVRQILGYDYAEGDAEILSCAAEPASPGSIEPFKLTAEVMNNSIEHKMFVSYAIEDRVRDIARRFESPSASLEVEESGNFHIEGLIASPPGELSVECSLRIGVAEMPPPDFDVWKEDAAYIIFDWLAPELDRMSANLRVQEYSERASTEAKLSECSALVQEDGKVALTAAPKATKRGKK